MKQAGFDSAAHSFFGSAVEDCNLPDSQKLTVVIAAGRMGNADRISRCGG
tara:strand:- start:13719 stop:13868 length:150 start_codon:yes stop_codon:yes gene_type:complete